MSRLPIIDFKRMDMLLRQLGFRVVRQHGSHVFYAHPDGRTTTVPNHPGRDLARPLIREIQLSPEEYENELNRRK